jgi:hypothetical protein
MYICVLQLYIAVALNCLPHTAEVLQKMVPLKHKTPGSLLAGTSHNLHPSRITNPSRNRLFHWMWCHKRREEDDQSIHHMPCCDAMGNFVSSFGAPHTVSRVSCSCFNSAIIWWLHRTSSSGYEAIYLSFSPTDVGGWCRSRRWTTTPLVLCVSITAVIVNYSSRSSHINQTTKALSASAHIPTTTRRNKRAPSQRA